MTASSPSILAIILARGGSKGLPRKNVLDLAGKPLIAWTVEAGLQARCVSRIIVSTDDDEIAQAALDAGADVPFRRPAALASDTATSLDAVLHAIDSLPETYDYIVLLQPTSPLRTAAHIDGAFDLLQTHDAPSCVSVCEVVKSPYLMVEFGEDARIAPVLSLHGKSHRRQDLPPVYELNGAIYITTPAALRAAGSFVTEATVGFVMPRALSADIDTRADLHTVQTYLNEDHHAET